jgi:hypothetical protein
MVPVAMMNVGVVVTPIAMIIVDPVRLSVLTHREKNGSDCN